MPLVRALQICNSYIRVLDRHALLEHGLTLEDTDYIIAFVEQAMFLFRIGSAAGNDPSESCCLATSVVARDEELAISGLACVVHFPKFLPDGVLQQLVSTCTAQSEVTEHKISRRDSKVSGPGGYVAFK